MYVHFLMFLMQALTVVVSWMSVGARHTPHHLATGSLNITLLYAAKSGIRWTDGVADLYTTSRLICDDLRRVTSVEMIAKSALVKKYCCIKFLRDGR